MIDLTIERTTEMFLNHIAFSRSKSTKQTYCNAMKSFLEMLTDYNIFSSQSISNLSEKQFSDFAKYLKSYAPATENLYINVAKNYFEFLTAENLKEFNMIQARYLIKNRVRKSGIRLPQFPQHNIETVIKYAMYDIPILPTVERNQKLINLRDSAFLLTLADTGLRVHEACNLRRRDIDWYAKKAIIIGKGNKQALVRFSDRSINALQKYLAERNAPDTITDDLPIFAPHDKGAGQKILPMTTKTGRLIVSSRVKECLGEEAVGMITPHSFRHYFVTNVLRKTGNMKIAQEFARHSSITITQRYTHLTDYELDQSYNQIFNNR